MRRDLMTTETLQRSIQPRQHLSQGEDCKLRSCREAQSASSHLDRMTP